MFCILNLLSNVNEWKKKVSGVVSKGGCQRTCRNTIGSFICSCNNGYALTDDQRTCEGMIKTSIAPLSSLREKSWKMIYQKLHFSIASDYKLSQMQNYFRFFLKRFNLQVKKIFFNKMSELMIHADFVPVIDFLVTFF